MGKYCEVCHRGTISGNAVSHTRSHVSGRTRRIWAPNVQKVRAVVGGTPQRLHVCTRCLRSGKVQRSV